MQGFANLQSVEDLLIKLRHDLAQLERSPSDSYAALNFFLTAEHMADWYLPGGTNDAARMALKKSEVLLQTCSHLANGAKHFRAEAKHHQSVVDSRQNKGIFGNAFPNAYGSVFHRAIEIDLQGTAKQQYGKSITAVDLASKILKYWEARLLPPNPV